jgi:hypothetical protein
MPKEQQVEQRLETNRRHALKKRKVLNSHMQAAQNYRRYVAHSLALAKTTDELEAMAKAAAEEGANA